jgi:pseudaminic acid synthase
MGTSVSNKLSPEIIIDGRRIGLNNPPYIIAEMSANHNGSIENAIMIINEAKKCGADAVKLQTYTADTLTMRSQNPDFLIKNGLWKGKTLYDLYSSAQMPWDWHKPLFEHAKKVGITIFSTPFDESAVDFLEELNVPAYKIASFEAIDLPLIKYVASTGKPMIISTGMANLLEITEAIDAAKVAGCKEIAVLHCVSGYPAPIVDCNLQTIFDMRTRFGLVAGLSDHTLNDTAATVSIAFGASIIEKHFTLNRSGGGPDDSFSIEPMELDKMCKVLRCAWEAIGEVDYSLKKSEEENIKFRRSLYFVESLQRGEILKKEHIKSIRPGYGLAPKYIDMLIGRALEDDVQAGSPVSWSYISSKN